MRIAPVLPQPGHPKLAPAPPAQVRSFPVSWFVYLVRCRDGLLYTGIAVDVLARVAAHNAGRGSPLHPQPAARHPGAHGAQAHALHRPEPGGGYQGPAPDGEAGVDLGKCQ